MELFLQSGVFKDGRYAGRPYYEVAVEHPSYVVWAYEENHEDIPRDIYEEALALMDNEYGDEFDNDYED